MQYHYNSADNHLDSRWLPKNLFQERLPAKLRDSGPKVVETAEGSRWEWEGKIRGDAADGSSNARMLAHYFPGNVPPSGSLPPADPALILKHMDLAGIHSGVFYGDTRKWGIDDLELRLAVYRTYNDFVMELNSHNPNRIVVLPNLPTFAPEECPAELDRMIKKGAKAVEFGVFDVGEPLFEATWDGVWSRAAEAGVVVCSHIGDRAGVAYPPNVRGSQLAHYATAPFSIAKQIAQYVFCGAFERNPTLKVSVAECRIGWLPFLITWMDRQITERKPDPTSPLSMLPSEYVRRNMTFTFEEDYVGARMIPEEWAHLKDTVVWGSDYPHEQGTWPDPSAAIDIMFEGIDSGLKREILFDRTARVFDLEVGNYGPA